MRILGGLLALLLCAPALRADSIADEADFRFHRAANLYRQGKVEEALSEFLASNRLVRNRNVIFNIARSFEQLKSFNEAYRWYTELLADEMPEADRKDLLEALKRLRPSLALLQVESSPPGATVYVDRKDLGARGQTPVTLALPPAKVTAMVELAGFRPHQQAVTLAVGRTALVNPSLERIYGSLAVEGDPAGAELRLEGETAPLELWQGRAKVIPGAHILTISAPGHASEQIAVEVPADGVAPVKFKLPPLPPPAGALVVRANLDGALVRVDGKEAGFTPGVIDNVVVGRHRVEILAEGREPVVEQIDVAKNERSFVDVKLRYAVPRVVAAEKELTQAQDAPASITIISAEEIRGFGYTTLAEALQSVRGLYTTYDRDYATVGVRGFSSPGVYNSRVLVLSDGHITNESSLGQGYVGHDFDADLSDVERIEVVRGPGSVLYGSAAFFAVVNVVHRTPSRGLHGEVGGLLGTLGENSGHAIFSAAGESAYGWARASGLNLDGEPFFVNPGTGATARDLDGERVGHVDLRARAGDFTLAASYNDRRKDLPTAAFDTIFGAPGTYTHDRRGFIEAQLNHAFWSGLGLDLRASYDYEKYNGQWQYRNTALGNFGSDSSGEEWGTAEARLRLPELAGHRIFIGGEFQDRWKVNLNAVVPADVSGAGYTHWSNFNDGIGPPAAAPNSEVVLSGYLGDDWRIMPRAQLDAAVRVDKFIDNFPAGAPGQQAAAAVNPRVALLLQPYDAGHTKLLFGRAYRYPGFYERYYNDGGASQVAAPNLKPEAVYTAEVEHVHQFSDEVSASLAGYLSEMIDLIRIGSPPGQPDISQYQNRTFPVHAAGGEVEVRWQAGPSWIFSGWYAYSIVRDDSAVLNGVLTRTNWFAGTPVANSPSSAGAVRALYPLLPQTLSVSTELVYGGPRRSIPNADGSVNLIGERLIWNLGLSGEYSRYGLRYGAFVYNLLDQKPLLPAGPEVAFPNHAVPQYGRTLRLQFAAAF
jgi:outer membrane receptor protein involved in Fe transport